MDDTVILLKKTKMGELKEAQRQIDALSNILKEDFRLLLKFKTDLKNAKSTIFPEILHLLEEAFGLPENPPTVCILFRKKLKYFVISL